MLYSSMRLVGVQVAAAEKHCCAAVLLCTGRIGSLMLHPAFECSTGSSVRLVGLQVAAAGRLTLQQRCCALRKLAVSQAATA
jgi:hypothetical protein